MSLGHKNPETTAKPRTKALAGMSSELVPWSGYALQPLPSCLRLENAIFQNWGGVRDQLHCAFQFCPYLKSF